MALDVPLAGRVAEVFVSDGQEVKRGTPLLQLEDEVFRLRVREAEVARTAAQLEKEAAEQDRRAWPYRLAAQQTAVAAARERYEAARKLLEEKLKAGKLQIVGTVELLLAESEVRQSQRLLELEESRWREMQVIDPDMRVRIAETRCQSAQLAVLQAEKTLRDRPRAIPCPNHAKSRLSSDPTVPGEVRGYRGNPPWFSRRTCAHPEVPIEARTRRRRCSV
jgi:multidrug resistance efflux pump